MPPGVVVLVSLGACAFVLALRRGMIRTTSAALPTAVEARLDPLVVRDSYRRLDAPLTEIEQKQVEYFAAGVLAYTVLLVAFAAMTVAWAGWALVSWVF